MESSELFLVVWAVAASVLAIYFQHHASMRGKLLIVMSLGMKHVAEGKAEIYVEDGEIRIKKKGEENA